MQNIYKKIILPFIRKNREKTLLIIFLFCILFPGFSDVNAQQTDDNKYRLAKMYEDEGDFDSAIRLLNELYSSSKTNYEYFNSLNELYLKLKNYRASETIIRERMNLYPEDFQNEMLLGNTLIISGRENEGFQMWDKAIEKSGYSEFAYSIAADYAVSNRVFGKAVEILSDAVKKLDNPPGIISKLAYVYSLSADYAKAAQEYCKLLLIKPAQVFIVKDRFRQILRSPESYSIAGAVVTEYFNDSGNTVFLEILIDILMRSGNLDESLTRIKEFDSRKPDAAKLLEFANTAMQNKSYGLAGDAYSYLLVKYADSPVYYQAKIGYAKAKEASLDEKYFASQELWKNYRNDTIVNKEEYLECIKLYLEISEGRIKRTEGSEAALRAASIYLDRLKNEKEAGILFRLVKTETSSARFAALANIQMGTIAFRNDNCAEAEKLFKDVLTHRLSTPEDKNYALYMLARIKFALCLFKEADSLMRKASESSNLNAANDALELSLVLGLSGKDSLSLCKYAGAEKKLESGKFKEAAEEFLMLADSDIFFTLRQSAEIKYIEALIALGYYDVAVLRINNKINGNEIKIFGDKMLFLLSKIYLYGQKNKPEAERNLRGFLVQFPQSPYINEVRDLLKNL